MTNPIPAEPRNDAYAREHFPAERESVPDERTGPCRCAGCRPSAEQLAALAHTTDDERKALAIARNIINRIGDLYYERIPSSDWVKVRQETNDELDQFVSRLILDFRRQGPITDTQVDAVAARILGARASEHGSAPWDWARARARGFLEAARSAS